MRMAVANVAVAAWCMNGEVDRCPMPVGKITSKGADKGKPLISIQFMRKCHFELACQPRILPLLGKFNRVPQRRSVERPCRLRALRKHDLRMHDTGLGCEVMHEAVALVDHARGRAIGDCGHGTSAARAADRLHAAMVDRHLQSPARLRPAEH